MRHLDLFSGIGGFALAARWMGWHTVGFCEIDPYCQQVLQKNFPHTPIYDDIRTIPPIGNIDILTGGFPCQPFSVAGIKKGKEDDRHLWPKMLEVIACEKPTFVVGENVAGIIGMALDEVLSELEGQGYATQSFVIPACSVDAPHKRDRVWILAHTNSNRIFPPPEEHCIHRSCENETKGSALTSNTSGSSTPLAHTQGERIQGLRTCGQQVAHSHAGKGLPVRESERSRETNWKAEPRVDRVVDGLPNRVDRIKGLGNAIVPQVAFQIYQAINKFNNQ